MAETIRRTTENRGRLREAARRLTALFASNMPKRELSRLARPEQWRAAADLLAAAERPVLVTGFFVPEAEAPETDGPPGAMVLADTLRRLGKSPQLVTDAFCRQAVEPAAVSLYGLPLHCAADAEDVLALRPDALVFIERVGRAGDGRYYNMRGRDISSWTPPLDDAAAEAAGRGIPVVAIGDGGNEAGMGCFRRALPGLIPRFAGFCSVVSADAPLPVDVSNWGGYGLAALLALMEDDTDAFVHSPEGEGCLLEALVDAGCVDGVSLRREPSADGYPLEVHQECVAHLQGIVTGT
ncbi:MAG: DUF4392 domain-containing protein [Synergistales bacterium]|nr:DUF4392 domain-containing protein [Synergistales bacterium]